ncbi:hypothetical protein [Diaphorobacter sp. J5-51]|uniref:hypothetical protein n=1 Tax=Diaphorobacter sp. J5-51 TaxID=680496 RepID=UPI0012F7C449|nr:hypothetical protein [Diaphorobacter sp. J5-51]
MLLSGLLALSLFLDLRRRENDLGVDPVGNLHWYGAVALLARARGAGQMAVNLAFAGGALAHQRPQVAVVLDLQHLGFLCVLGCLWVFQRKQLCGFRPFFPLSGGCLFGGFFALRTPSPPDIHSRQRVACLVVVILRTVNHAGAKASRHAEL